MTRLTDSYAKTVEIPPTGDEFHFDEDQKGFALRVYSSGSKKWVYAAKIRGKVYRRVIGDSTLYTAQQARGIARQVAGELRQGVDRYMEMKEAEKERKAEALRKLADDTSPYIDDAIETYIEKKKLKPTTAYFYTKLQRSELAPYANTKLKDINNEKLLDMVAEISQKHSEYCATKAIGLLRSVMRHFGVNPDMTGIKLKKAKAREARLDPVNGKAVWKAIEAIECPTHRAFLGISLLTGCRMTELASTIIGDIDLENGFMLFRNTKNGTDHKVYLSPKCAELVAERMAGKHRDQRLFNSPVVVSRVKGLDNIGIPKFGNHDLRKAFAITCMDLGIHEYVMKKALNHLDPTNVTFAHYARATPSQLRDCWNRVEKYYTS